MSEKSAAGYLSEIARYYADPSSSEMSYRTAFQNYLDSIFPKEEKYHIQHDPKAEKGNKPDFIVLRDKVPLLYIEVKKVGEDLDKIEKSPQATRYFGYTNLIISDYCEFRFYRNGVKYEAEPITLATVQSGAIASHPEKGELLERTMRDFMESQKEPIRSGKHLAKIMGGKAQRIRDNVIAFLEKEGTDKDELVRMMSFIKDHLIANFEIKDFADMYAQTLVYGLFAARYNDPSLGDFTRQEARELVPKTNPFLQHFFDHIAGSSFPKRLEIIVDELCAVFSHADVKTLMEEYFKQGALLGPDKESPDPVIHFYEDFLREYDSAKKMEMGVFYTPLPVVRFIVRGIDDILKKEFGIEKGLADNSKIEQEILVPGKGGVLKKDKHEVHRVQVLDVAVGTGTFLNETIRHIYETFKGNEGRWGAYVESDLLPRLHGFELMMASYTIAHLKLAMTLTKTGVTSFGKRIGVYLSNTLDDAHEIIHTDSLFGAVSSIALESKLASEVKKEHPIMVVMGNPPYSGESMNPHYTGNDVYKVEIGGKEKLKERNSKWINDDYVKFIRFAESMIENNGEGVIGMITAHGYIDNPTFRGMRWHLRQTFDSIYVLDLHGNSNKKETAPDGSADVNVFDIKTGVSIIFGIKKQRIDVKKDKPLATVYQNDFFGTRAEKFATLSMGNINNIVWNELPEVADIWKVEGGGKAEYQKGFSVADLFIVNSVGIVTARDAMSIQHSLADIQAVVVDFKHENVDTLRAKYNLGKDVRDWSVIGAKNDLEKDDGVFTKVAYRPFDMRFTYYTGRSKGFHCMPRGEIMKDFWRGKNLVLLLSRQGSAANPLYYDTASVSDTIVDFNYFRRGGEAIFPLYLYKSGGEKINNLNTEIIKAVEDVVGKITHEDIFDYIYAILHSPSYRAQYAEFLMSDFPRVPFPKDKERFWKLVPLGTKLRNLHLLTDNEVNNRITSFPVVGSDAVEKLTYKAGRVYINDTQYWDGVPEAVWGFYIGGYQPAQKYLKDRKGRALTSAEFENYEHMIVSLSRTIEIMKQIDTI